MRHLTIALTTILALFFVAPLHTGAIYRPPTTTPTPTPSDHVVLGTPTAIPAPAAPLLSVVWLRPGLARASWAGPACLHRYSATGVHLFVGCAASAIDTPAEMGDTFRVVSGAASVSARVGVRGAALLPIVR